MTKKDSKGKGLNQDEFFQAYLKYSRVIWEYVYAKTGTNGLTDNIVQNVLVSFWKLREEVEPDQILPRLYCIADEQLKAQT